MAGRGRGRGSGGSWRDMAMGTHKPPAPAGAPPAAPAPTTNGGSTFKNHLTGAGVNHIDNRLLFVSQVLIGHTVLIKVRGGQMYEGIFSTIEVESEGELSVMLKMAKMVQSTDGSGTDMKQLAEKPMKSLVIPGEDLLQVIAKDVKMSAQDVGPEMEDMGFGTDSAISQQRGGAGRVGRELEKWIPDGPDMVALEDMSMDVGGYTQGGWDQFAANETMYGVHTSFDEAIYTTTIDKKSAKISEREAARLAREIERGQMDTSNVHLMEERNLAVDDSGIDEEDKYSSVIRSDVPPPAPKGPKKPAWSTAGAGVEVLQGPKATEPPKPPPAKPLESSKPPTETADAKPAEATKAEEPKSDTKSDTKTDDKPKGDELTSSKAGADNCKVEEEPKKPKSKLNPAAKPFKMNVNAAAFVPGGAAARTDTPTSTSSAGSTTSGGGGGGHKSRGNSGNWNNGPQGGGMGGQGWNVGGMPGPGGGYNMGMMHGMMPGMGGPGQPRPGMMPHGGYGGPQFYPQMTNQYFAPQPFVGHSQYMGPGGPMPPGGARGQHGGYVPYNGGMGMGMGMGPDGQPASSGAGGGGNK